MERPRCVLVVTPCVPLKLHVVVAMLCAAADAGAFFRLAEVLKVVLFVPEDLIKGFLLFSFPTDCPLTASLPDTTG